jgi:hypothetical protein
VSAAHQGPENGIVATFRVNLSTEKEARLWVQRLQEKTFTTYTVETTRQNTGTLVKYKCYFKCQHKTRSLRKNSDKDHKMKNTSCPSKLSITIKAIHKRWQGKGNRPDPLLPCVIDLNFDHNHALKSADVLRFRPLGEDVKAKLLDLFRKGHSAATALESHRADLLLENENPEQLLADGRHCPDYSCCHRLYKKEFTREYGTDSKGSHDFLAKKIEDYNKEAGTRCMEMKQVGNEIIVVICTPIMKRVHKNIKQSAELVFVDSTGTVDKDGHRVFQILTHNEIGGLPLGILITESETTSTITTALQMLLELVGSEGFFGRGARGPDLFMTDDCDAEKRSLNSIWPSAVVLLCTFHVLQAFWRWVLNTKHGIPANERPTLFYLFKDIVYATTEEKCVDCYNTLVADRQAKKHPTYLKHVEDLWKRKEDWVLFFRSEQHMLVRGNNTNNYVEAAMRILKDNVLERVKAFNVVQLTDFIVTRLDSYYERKLLDGANNRCPRKTNSFPAASATIMSGIVRIGETRFSVPSQTTSDSYMVDLSIRVCTCVAGNTGAACKHQHWVDLLVGGGAQTVRSVATRALCYEVATGKQPDNEWLRPLHDSRGVQAELIDAASCDDACTSGTIPCNEDNQTISSDSDFEERLADQRARGEEAITTIKDMLLGFLYDAPEVVEPALQHAAAMLGKATTTASRVSILMTLGKGHVAQRKGTRIPVQPTAVARRRTAISGRSSSAGGRPRTSNPASAGTSATQSQPPKRKAPHKLAECVAKNIRLGATHSKK